MGNARRALAGGSVPPGPPALWISRPELGFFAVASPLGASEVAASFALESIVTNLGTVAEAGMATIEKAACARLRQAIQDSDRRWSQAVEQHPARRGLGATLGAVLLATDYAAVGHLGDCRIHQLRAAKCFRRSTDHVVPDAEGRMVIVRLFGSDSSPEVEGWDTEPNDVFLITSGIHTVVPEQELVARLFSIGDLTRAVAELTALAKDRGGADDLTALAFRVPGESAA